MIGAVEAGGTKFRIAVLDDQLAVVDEHRIETTQPAETLAAAIAFLANHTDSIDAVGIACFGPVDLNPTSGTYGSILSTPKPGWSGTSILSTFHDGLGVPCGIDSDVGGAALAEATLGVGRGHSTVVYVTVGTGIGGAMCHRSEVHRGHGHSELGHIPIQRAPHDDFPGACPYHDDCLEGMASGAAIAQRLALGEADPYEHIAGYLAQLVQVITYTFAPDVISFGGGVFNHPRLIDEVRTSTVSRLGGYLTAATAPAMDTYVVRSPLDQDAGLLGAGLIGAAAAAGR